MFIGMFSLLQSVQSSVASVTCVTLRRPGQLQMVLCGRDRQVLQQLGNGSEGVHRWPMCRQMTHKCSDDVSILSASASPDDLNSLFRIDFPYCKLKHYRYASGSCEFCIETFQWNAGVSVFGFSVIPLCIVLTCRKHFQHISARTSDLQDNKLSIQVFRLVFLHVADNDSYSVVRRVSLLKAPDICTLRLTLCMQRRLGSFDSLPQCKPQVNRQFLACIADSSLLVAAETELALQHFLQCFLCNAICHTDLYISCTTWGCKTCMAYCSKFPDLCQYTFFSQSHLVWIG